jgi:hypothetical protein
MSNRYYVDTSAYLCILLGEAGSKPLQRELEGAELVSSSLLILEAGRNLVRLSRERFLSPLEFQKCMSAVEEGMGQFLLRDLTLDLCRSLKMPAVSTPRSLDLAHLRTAIWFQAQMGLTRFVSLDELQNAAAREMGLPV